MPKIIYMKTYDIRCVALSLFVMNQWSVYCKVMNILLMGYEKLVVRPDGSAYIEATTTGNETIKMNLPANEWRLY